MIKSPLPLVICGSDRKTLKIFVVEYLNGTNFRVFFLEKNCISRVFIFAVCPFKDFFAGINFRGLLILCTFLNIAQISKIKEKKHERAFSQ